LTGPIAPRATPIGAALQISYRTAAPPQALLGIVSGGVELGWSGDGASSVTSVAFGSGAVVIFGGPISETVDSSLDMTSILMSHAYDISGVPASTTIQAHTFAEGHGLVRWSPQLFGSGHRRPAAVEIFALDPDLFGTVTGSWTTTPRQP
jgi:hypothetical protein